MKSMILLMRSIPVYLLDGFKHTFDSVYCDSLHAEDKYVFIPLIQRINILSYKKKIIVSHCRQPQDEDNYLKDRLHITGSICLHPD